MNTTNKIGYPSQDRPWLKYYTEEQINITLPQMTAYNYLKQQNATQLDASAIDSAHGNYTYRELFSAIDATAAALHAIGFGAGKKLLTLMPVLLHEILLLYGADAVGGAICLLPAEYTKDGILTTANKIEADLFFVHGRLLTPELEQTIYGETGIRTIVVIEPTQDPLDERTLSWATFLSMGQGISFPEAEKDPAGLLFLASTGGTTGEPKCVMLSDNCFNQAVHQLIHSDLGYAPGDTWLRLWPIFIASTAVAGCHLPLCAGMKMIIRPISSDFTGFDRMILEEKPNHLMMVPQLWDALEASPLMEGADLSFIKVAGGGGFGITREFEERVQRFFEAHNIHAYLGYGWGCTESSATISNRTSFATTRIGTSGAPMAKCVVAAFDPESGLELPYGEVGELCAQTPTLMMGYYNDPELTAKTLRTHPDGKIWLHSGDLGMVDADGLVTVTGRMTRTITVFPGLKVYPQALENAVSTVAGVHHVVFCKIPNPEHPGFWASVCFIVPEHGCTPEEVRQRVSRFCQETYPDYSCPRFIFMRESLPMTRANKPNILVLEQEATDWVTEEFRNTAQP